VVFRCQNQIVVDLVKYHEPCMSAFLCQRLPVKLRQHGSDIGCASVSAESVWSFSLADVRSNVLVLSHMHLTAFSIDEQLF